MTSLLRRHLFELVTRLASYADIFRARFAFLISVSAIFWCFRFENWYDNSVSIDSKFIDKIDSPNSKIDNYRLLTKKSFIDFYRIPKKLIDSYRLLSNVIDYRYCRLTTPGEKQNALDSRETQTTPRLLAYVKWAFHSK